MYSVLKNRGQITLVVGEHSQENRISALSYCAIRTLVNEGKPIESNKLENELLVCMEQGGSRKAIEGIIRKYLNLYIADETSEVFKLVFN